MMILNVRHTGLVVKNLKNSLKFYRDFLGLKLWKKKTENGRYIEKVVGIKKVKIKWAKLKSKDGALVELLEYVKSKTQTGDIGNSASDKLGCSHIAFTVEDADGFYEKMVRSGYHCVNKPQMSPDGMVKVMYCHDPDGIILEIVEEIKK